VWVEFAQHLHECCLNSHDPVDGLVCDQVGANWRAALRVLLRELGKDALVAEVG